jgi:hypothetical protein
MLNKIIFTMGSVVCLLVALAAIQACGGGPVPPLGPQTSGPDLNRPDCRVTNTCPDGGQK